MKFLYGLHQTLYIYAIRDVLENKTNAIPHPNMGSLKSAI